MALLGDAAAERFTDVEEASSRVELREEVTEPEKENVDFYKECFEVFRALCPATKDAMLCDAYRGSRQRRTTPK